MSIEEVIEEASEHAHAFLLTNGKYAIYWGAEWRTKTGRLRMFDSEDKAMRLFLKHLRTSHEAGLESVVYDVDGTVMDMVWY